MMDNGHYHPKMKNMKNISHHRHSFDINHHYHCHENHPHRNHTCYHLFYSNDANHHLYKHDKYVTLNLYHLVVSGINIPSCLS